MANHSGVVIEAQVDWLTVSAHGEEAATNLLTLARGLAKEEEGKGNRPRRFRLEGYEGTHCGSIEYGIRDRAATLVRAIGESANSNLDVLLSLGDRVPRLDLAVTWRADPPDPLHGRNAYALAEMFHQKHPASALPWTTNDAAGGWTTYVGKRESDNMLRVYNKGAECIATGDDVGAERYRGCWRYELEAKGTVSQRIAERVLIEEDRAEYVQSYVYLWARQHGLEPPFPQAGAVKLEPGFRRRADADSKLRHLEKNVKPTVSWLRQAGYEQNLRDALGIDPTSGLLRELQAILMRGSASVGESPRMGSGDKGV